MRALRLFTFAAVVAALGPATAFPVGPVVNGEFELVVPVKDDVCGVAGDASNDILPSRDPWLATVTPCEAGAVKALHWSSSRVAQFGDVDGDGDREVTIDGSITLPPNDSVGRSHNFWQAYPSPHQAYTADFDSIRFRVEDGEVPAGAYVQMSLSSTPLAAQHPYVLLFIDCFLTFRLEPGTTGTVEIDPLDASFTSAWEGCDPIAAAYAAANDHGKRTLLAQHRIVQLSFWGFETGAPVVLDGIELSGAKLVLEP